MKLIDTYQPTKLSQIIGNRQAIAKIDRRRRQELPCYVTVIFTSAKRKDELSDGQKKHWDELVTRCIKCKLEITSEEFNEFFTYVTMDYITDMYRKIAVKSIRAAWDYIEEQDIPIAG